MTNRRDPDVDNPHILVRILGLRVYPVEAHCVRNNTTRAPEQSEREREERERERERGRESERQRANGENNFTKT